jgi:hypothetical protein
VYLSTVVFVFVKLGEPTFVAYMFIIVISSFLKIELFFLS